MRFRELQALIAFVGFVAALALVLASTRPRESDIAAAAARPSLVIDRVEGIAFSASDELPAWSARHAWPASGAGPFEVAGLFAGLELADVELRIDASCRLCALHGRFDSQRLALTERVELQRTDGSRALVGSAAEVSGGAIAFDGLVVFDPDGAGRRQRLGLRVALDELSELGR